MYYYIMIIDFYCGGPLGWDWDEIGKSRGLEIRDEKGPSLFFFFFATFSFSLSLSLQSPSFWDNGGKRAPSSPRKKKKSFFLSIPTPTPTPPNPPTFLPYLTLYMGSSMPRKRKNFSFSLSGISLLFYMQAPKKSYFPPAPGPQSQRKNMIRSNFAPQKRRKKTALHANLFRHPSRHSTTPEYLFIFVLVCVEVIPLESW